jgi:hypothetical protein
VGVAQRIQKLVVQSFAFVKAFIETDKKHKDHAKVIKAVFRVVLVGKRVVLHDLGAAFLEHQILREVSIDFFHSKSPFFSFYLLDVNNFYYI